MGSICGSFSKYFAAPSGRITSIAVFSRMWVAGLATLIEPESRRGELAKYCTTYALDSLYKYALENNVIRPSILGGSLLLAWSSSVLCWNSDQLPSLVSNWLLDIKPTPTQPHHPVC